MHQFKVYGDTDMNTVFVCLFFTFCTIRFCNTKFCKTTLVSFVCNIHKIELRMKARRSSLSLSFLLKNLLGFDIFGLPVSGVLLYQDCSGCTEAAVFSFCSPELTVKITVIIIETSKTYSCTLDHYYMSQSIYDHTRGLCPLFHAEYWCNVNRLELLSGWDMHVEAKSLNPIKLFTLIMVYK